MTRKTMENLFGLCSEIWTKVDEFCGDSTSPMDRAVVFAAVRQRLLTYKRAETVEVVTQKNTKLIPEKVQETPEPEKKEKKKGMKKSPCKDKFNPEKSSKCFVECKENSPEEYQKCLEKFQGEVNKKANAKEKDTSEKKKGRSFDKDFWGFDKSSVTGKINEIVSKKFSTKSEIAEALGIDSQRVAVHFSNLKKGGFILQKKKDEMRGVLYKLTKEKSE